MAAEGSHDGAWNGSALGDPRSLEFLEFIDPSSWMDVARLEATSALVKPGLATMEFAR